MRFQLKENHPASIAFEAVQKAMDLNGITIRANSCGQLEIMHDSKTYTLRDADNGQPCYGVPWPFEYKITYDKED